MNLKDAAELQLEQNLKEMEMLECCVLIKLALTAECEVIYIYIYRQGNAAGRRSVASQLMSLLAAL
jgi:hypothetical protein